MQNHTCPEAWKCQDYDINHCDGCNDSLIDFTKREKKMILVGRKQDSVTWTFFNNVITELGVRSIDITAIDHYKLRFKTNHTEVWFVDERYANHFLDGVIPDAVFGECYEGILARVRKHTLISSRDHIGLVDYICDVELQAKAKEYLKDVSPKSYITTAGDQYSEFRKRMLNYTYGKFGLGGDTDGYYFVDLKSPSPEKVEFLRGRQNGKNADPLFQLKLYNALMKGENNMSTEERAYVRQDVQSLAAAFKRVNDAFNRKLPGIKNVIFSGPCTIVLWEDGTKTVVRCNNDVLDQEKGLAMAIAKKALGTNKSGSNYYDIFKKWLPKEGE